MQATSNRHVGGRLAKYPLSREEKPHLCLTNRCYNNESDGMKRKLKVSVKLSFSSDYIIYLNNESEFGEVTELPYLTNTSLLSIIIRSTSPALTALSIL